MNFIIRTLCDYLLKKKLFSWCIFFTVLEEQNIEEM